jgi:hypothetical protein
MELEYFLKENYNPIQIYKYPAYRLKHDYERETNIYMTEQEFITLMETIGYKCNKYNNYKLGYRKRLSMSS